ncbi:hypothetical protein OsI_01010 [Oryza sativa Indica Group]|uniref:Putative E3 ubiquitin-protein ligase LIN ARM-like domain-containing protein n=1 Tax=Oryza sativa subsp. indica TaxID=39946 RepID=B8AB06_ORYSI|nr:hypothetical protein OsI_01010 [Oryza sativa Indica Group]
MAEDRSWMYKRVVNGYISDEYLKGVKRFMSHAVSKLQVQAEKRDLLENYHVWSRHGESGADTSETPEDSIDNEMNEGGNAYGESDHIDEMLLDAAGPNFCQNIEEPPNAEAASFFDMLDAANKPLWEKCGKHSQLSAVSRLLTIKSDHNMSVACFDELVKVMKEMLPPDANLPGSFYKCKKVVEALGMPVQKIDVCKNDCMLYYKEHANKRKCITCNEPRYIEGLELPENKKGTPQKVLRYLPIIPRLQRLYMSRGTATHMTYHKDGLESERCNNESRKKKLTHPAESEAWKHIDSKYPNFAKEPRNVGTPVALRAIRCGTSCSPVPDTQAQHSYLVGVCRSAVPRSFLLRRSAADRLLRTIKEASSFSMMHTLLVYLQSTTPEQSPVVAGLLLQLDLLVEPRKISMYREEAVDSLIQCLKNSDYPRSQLLAAETIMNLSGKFSSSGRPLSRSSLLKLARVKERHRPSHDLSISRGAGEDEMEEEKAAAEWERKAAYALVSHEFGLVFEALSGCLAAAKNGELFTASLVSAAWLVRMLPLLPDTGVLGAARVCLLRQLVLVLRSGKHGSDRALAMVALRSFMNDREGMHEITTYIKDVLRTLRELKKSSGLAFEMLKLLSDGQESSIDMWNHKELNHADCSSNGEVTSIAYFKGYIFSGHSDGTLKVWEGSENILRLVHESQEHTKAITSLAVLHSEEKLFSGSLDRTIRVWQLRDALRCVEVHDAKDPVQSLAVAAAMACFAPQGSGVKVLSWNNGGGAKVLNASKVVRSMALVHGKLFCGCNDGGVQEIDLASGTIGVIQQGSKRIIGKASPIYSLHLHGDLLYTGSTSLDGASVKIWSSSNYSLVGTIPSSVEVRSLVVSSDLVYLGSRNGVVEIWSREKLTRIGALQAAGGGGGRVQCMAVDADGDVIVVGTSDGRIQAWGLT